MKGALAWTETQGLWEIDFDNRRKIRLFTGALFMTSFVKLTICSSQHGAKMRQMGWCSGSDAGGNVEAQF
jgi:hypothetical protein